ncbi:hypothetical protein EON64_00645 [archaeon]|nr:MAG: hypothetical protein EON64_00645 [archaeon]
MSHRGLAIYRANLAIILPTLPATHNPTLDLVSPGLILACKRSHCQFPILVSKVGRTLSIPSNSNSIRNSNIRGDKLVSPPLAATLWVIQTSMQLVQTEQELPATSTR